MATLPAMRATTPRLTVAIVLLVALGGITAGLLPPTAARADGAERVAVPRDIVHVDDGDTVRLDWPGKASEEVRILGIDTPEVLHLDHDLPFPQPFGDQATGFLQGCLAAATKVELLRAPTKDRYGRTLGYLYVNDRNYSTLVIAARLAYGPNPRFGDNGFPAQMKACTEAAAKAGPPPFEPPWQYRRRMREVTKFMKANGTYPRVSRNEGDAKDASGKK